MRLRNTLMGLAAGTAATAMLVPASAGAVAKFGADLTGGPQPQNGVSNCGDSGLDPNNSCTRIAYSYSDVGAVQNNSKAPKDGRIDKLKLIAEDDGKFTFQLGRIKDLDSGAGTGKGKITRSGGTIHYDQSLQKRGAGVEVQTFNIDVAVKKNEYMAFKAKNFAAQSCSSGSERELLFQPPPAVGGPFQNEDANEDCTILVQAIYE